MKLRSALAIALAPLAIHAGAGAHPTSSVFVADEDSAWWLSKTVVRPMDKQVDGISVETLSSYDSGSAVPTPKICFVAGLSANQIAGISRRQQGKIDETLKEAGTEAFYRTGTTADGTRWALRSAVFESCDGEKGGLLITYNPQTRQLYRLDVQPDQPLNFLFGAEAPALARSGGCFFCGDSSALYYDAQRKRFYWEYEGD